MAAQKIIPGPTGIHTLKTLFRYYRAPLPTFQNLRDTFGDIFQIKFWKYHVIHLSHPDDIHAVLQNPNDEVTAALNASDPVVGKGLSTNTGKAWLRQRRMIQPAFHHEKITRYLEPLAWEAQKMLGRWEGFAARQMPFDLAQELVALNHAQLYQALFGDELSPANQAILDALKFVRMYTAQRTSAVFSIPQTWPTPHNRRFWQAVRLLDEFTYDLIKQRQNSPSENDDILTYMIRVRDKSGQGMSEKQLHDEIMTMFFAAYEDAANALVWAFYELSRHPEVAEKLVREVDQVLQKNSLDFDGLQKLPYSSQIIDETLRLYPPTWSLLRDVRQNEHLRGYRIPKGAIVILNIYLLHRHPQFWPAPDTFDPERFSAEKAALTRKPTYIPFGSGGRKCIGYSLALTQMRVNLALIAQKYRVVPQADYPVKAQIDSGLRIEGGLPVRIFPRN